MKKNFLLSFLLLFPLFIFGQTINSKDSLYLFVFQKVKLIEKNINDTFPVAGAVKLDTIKIDYATKKIDIYFFRPLSYMPLRENNVEYIYWLINKELSSKLFNYKVSIYSGIDLLEELIPNYFRTTIPIDKSRFQKIETNRIPIVQNLSKNFVPEKGLFNKNIALANSHGWYYEPALNRWEWQRARLFQTVEDLYTASYVIPFLAPMLENAGANVFIPRERDVQVNEVIVDNDDNFKNTTNYKEIILKSEKWKQSENLLGFKNQQTFLEKQNPFRLGTYKYISSSKDETTKIQWVANFPEAGNYAVYISYASLENSATKVQYSVYHLGGKTDFVVNQQIGGGTWVYLGTFKFKKGTNPELGRVEISNKNAENTIITADAVKFGGGMGNIERNGQISGKSRFSEASRYYLQFAGIPDSVLYTAPRSEILGDGLGRANWVNYLKNSYLDTNFKVNGLNIPIDLSLSFHTDAGTTLDSSIIGTLAIYDREYEHSNFPDGSSRLASRDLADLMQTQIVDDIRAKYNKNWQRRGLWNKEYTEARIPSVPTVLLELLSHQNLADMMYGQNPQFRFDVSRSIYKAFLKFLAFQNASQYVVQPLPVAYFQAEFSEQNNVVLKWQETFDSLEVSAKPTKYKVYIRKENFDFDNGTIVEKPTFVHQNIENDVIYSYKVTALNEGGESFPSEILSICKVSNSKKTVLIINGFDRISAPEIIDNKNFRGFANFKDAGVPYIYNFHFIGTQYDFDPNSAWLDDDAPGHGASNANYEGKLIIGNTFDYPFIHGKAIKNAGFSFVSCSDEAVEMQNVSLNNYSIVDFIYGEEKETHSYNSDKKEFKIFTPEIKKQIEIYCKNKGNLLLSGAYLGSDLNTKNDEAFAANILKYKFRTSNADVVGKVHSVDSNFNLNTFAFNTEYSPEIYTVEAPNAIEPANDEAKTIFRYSSNNTSAAVAYKSNYKVFVCGFPFESILTEKSRNEYMKVILDFFN